MATSNTSIQPRTLKFSHSGSSSSAQIIESELEFTDLLKTLLDFGNENVYRSFKIELVIVEDEKDNQVNFRK